MVDGNTVMEMGVPFGPAVGKALGLARWLEAEGYTDAAIRSRIEFAVNYPELSQDRELASSILVTLQREVDEERERLREEPATYRVFGQEIIDGEAISQLRDAMCLPDAVAGALMPDAHVGYGVPVGGVVAMKDAVIPGAVGVDIACRMKLTVLNLSAYVLGQRRGELREALLRSTNFGKGGRFQPGRRSEHPIMDDPRWESTSLLRKLKDIAYAQLGTSGTGNHFVEWGKYESAIQMKAMHPTLAILSHSGSRAVGAKIEKQFSKIAKQKRPHAGDLAWLYIGEEAGAEYWHAMQLAGDYASANHAVIHDKMIEAIGAESIGGVENHHNFAWSENHDGEDLIVHRKGATPASTGEAGVIPGTMVFGGYIVVGKGNPSSLRSASHGAGRIMSRTQAKALLDKRSWQDNLLRRGVTLIGGDVDEAPGAYKELDTVMDHQRDLVDVTGRFTPSIVRMADPESRRR